MLCEVLNEVTEAQGEKEKLAQELTAELGMISGSLNSTEMSPTSHKWDVLFWACKQVY